MYSCLEAEMTSITEYIESLATQVTLASWSVFLLAWSIGWVLRGSPIPLARVRRAGQSFIEDAVWAAFWLSVGSLVFALVSRIAQVLQGSGP
jgi:hypothetical protein